MNFKLFQMDVKSVFLNEHHQEEVFVDQPLGFINPTFPDHFLMLKKDLYSLKQASRAWYDCLSKFMWEKQIP